MSNSQINTSPTHPRDVLTHQLLAIIAMLQFRTPEVGIGYDLAPFFFALQYGKMVYPVRIRIATKDRIYTVRLRGEKNADGKWNFTLYGKGGKRRLRADLAEKYSKIVGERISIAIRLIMPKRDHPEKVVEESSATA